MYSVIPKKIDIYSENQINVARIVLCVHVINTANKKYGCVELILKK